MTDNKMLRNLGVALFVSLFIGFPYIAAAGSDNCLELDSEIGKVIREVIPSEAKINSICPSTISGVYELVVNDKQMVYVNPASKTIILGVLIQGGINLTEKRQTELGLLQKPEKRQTAPLDNDLEKEVIPPDGMVLPVKWGDLGKQMVEAGVIDAQRLEEIYSQRGGLGKQDKEVLYGTDNGHLKLTSENSGFLLNMLWALGLGNKNDILEKGPMTTRSGNAGRFASTGGWTLAKGNVMQHYSKHPFIVLNQDQQALVERVSKNIYRPCCNNPTYFPDCNHGMAMLGFLELMASQGIGEEDMYRIALQVNSYWFPDTYLTIATLFKGQGIEWKDVNAKEVLGFNYSSGSGYQRIRNKVQPSRSGGGGACGV